MVRRTKPGISRFSDVQLHIVARSLCARPGMTAIVSPPPSTMRSLCLQNSMDVVAFPAGFLVVDLHVKRQRTLASRKDRVEVIGEGAENMFAGLLAGRQIAPLAKPQHHVEEAKMRTSIGDGVMLATGGTQ